MREGKTKSWKKKEKKEHTDNSMSCGVCRSSCSRINIAPRASFSLVMVENSPPMMKLKNYYLMMVPLLTAANMGVGIAQQTLLDVLKTGMLSLVPQNVLWCTWHDYFEEREWIYASCVRCVLSKKLRHWVSWYNVDSWCNVRRECCMWGDGIRFRW